MVVVLSSKSQYDQAVNILLTPVIPDCSRNQMGGHGAHLLSLARMVRWRLLSRTKTDEEGSTASSLPPSTYGASFPRGRSKADCPSGFSHALNELVLSLISDSHKPNFLIIKLTVCPRILTTCTLSLLQVSEYSSGVILYGC